MEMKKMRGKGGESRRRILNLLAESPKTWNELKVLLDLSDACLSKAMSGLIKPSDIHSSPVLKKYDSKNDRMTYELNPITPKDMDEKAQEAFDVYCDVEILKKILQKTVGNKKYVSMQDIINFVNQVMKKEPNFQSEDMHDYLFELHESDNFGKIFFFCQMLQLINHKLNISIEDVKIKINSGVSPSK